MYDFLIWLQGFENPVLTKFFSFVSDLIAPIPLSVIAIIVLLMKYKDMFRFEPSKSVLAPGKKALYFITSPALLFALAAAFAITLEYVYLI